MSRRLIVLLVVVSSLAASVYAAPLFGPATYVRGSGLPIQFIASFSRRGVADHYMLLVESRSVSSAAVTLNGRSVLQESDFNPNVTTLTREIALDAENTLEVR